MDVIIYLHNLFVKHLPYTPVNYEIRIFRCLYLAGSSGYHDFQGQGFGVWHL